MKLWRNLLCCCLIVACTPVEQTSSPTRTTVHSVRFPSQSMPRGVTRSNATLAEDFIDLTFALESGQPLTRLLRYEGAIRVAMPSPLLAPYQRDLQDLLRRLQREAGISISLVSDPASAQIHIEAVPAREIQRVYPGAACFIVPGETNWDDFRRKSRRQRQRWSEQQTLGTTAIFVPSDSTPQDIRDCLHEEIGQALGPANDIYRLPDSVFNDDNFHSILTSFDMLMLRALYHPDLRSGMSKSAVAGRIMQVLNEINPKGRGTGSLARAPSSPEWKTAIETAMTRSNSLSTRRRAANRAVSLALAMKPQDHRLGVALLTRGRLSLQSDPTAGARDFTQSYELFRKRLGSDDIRTAQAGLHLSVLALATKDFDVVLELVDRSIKPALMGQNAVLASGLYAVRSEALIGLGETEEATKARLESLKWARFAFGDTNGVIASAQAKLEEFGPNRSATAAKAEQ